MDPSALIFIALAAAWAIYLIPKALEHHEESVRTRTVERFSATLRVLARREPVSRRQARLVRTRPASSAANTHPEAAPQSAATAPDVTRRQPSAAARAAKRRLRVVTLILLALVVVIVLAVVHVVAWLWVAAPVAVLVAWLVACRLMVKRERATTVVRRSRPAPRVPATAPSAVAPEVATREVDAETTGSIDAVTGDADVQGSAERVDFGVGRPDPTDPQSWDPVPVTLPTYVSKPLAPRSVRQIDLDSTGVWTSGRSESDSELVRENQARTTESGGADRSVRRRRA